MPSSEIAGLTEDTTPDTTDITYVQDAAGTVDKKVPLSKLPVSDASTAAITAAVLAHTSDGSAAHAASAISIADSGNDFTATDVEGALAELQSDAETDAAALATHAALTAAAHGIADTAAVPAVCVEDGAGGYETIPATARIYIGAIDPAGGGVTGGRDEEYDIWLDVSP
jgi:hypothetical protein